MGSVWEKLRICRDFIIKRTDFVPRAAVVLGSGLGGFADKIDVSETFLYKDIPGFPIPTVSGHAGQLLLGYIGDVPVVVLRGRVHYYECCSMEDVVLPVRLTRLLGAQTLVLTNAAGGINKELYPGSFMLIKDHISSFVPSPLIGGNVDELGTRFPDMSEVYDKEFRSAAKSAAARVGIPLYEGVYLQTTGPQYETPSEIKMFEKLGADAVGMSTACEAVAARHAGMRVCALSCITNMAAGIQKSPLSHNEVKQTADNAADLFEKLLAETISAIGGVL